LEDYLDREPTELEKQWEEVSLLQADRLEKALRGELPVSEGTQKRYEEEKKSMQERLSRKLGSGWEESTAGIRAMNEFEQRWQTIMDAERRGEIAQGAPMLLSNLGYQYQTEVGRGYGQPMGIAQPSPGFARGISLLQGAGTYGYGQSMAGFEGMSQAYTRAYQPYQFYTGATMQAAMHNAQMAMREREGKGQLFGTIAGGLLGFGGSIISPIKIR